MDIQEAYDRWSQQYDSNENPTRDLEARSIRRLLHDLSFTNCLEMGCGTGKNTVWLATKSNNLTSVDLSPEMLAIARSRNYEKQVRFVQGDMLDEWHFASGNYDLISFSLVLEHIENLQEIFRKAAALLSPGGRIYIGELHPFKQYAGSKARFETSEGTQVVTCFTHHISDFIHAAEMNGFSLERLEEFFDDNNKDIPRILSLIFINK
jgi:ubiquinone/menaquinone biosynthesis C-methylase UbiE